jgi:hypothetical protein
MGPSERSVAFRTSGEYRQTWAELCRFGMLLLQDPQLPNVAALVAGGPVSGSWWSHPRGRDIYQIAGQIEAHPEVLATKLLSGKVTFVHKTLWAAFLAVARAAEPWQLGGMSLAARNLLRRVQREGSLGADDVAGAGIATRSAGGAVLELEQRLLVHAEQVHTGGGAHAKRIETWDTWAAAAPYTGPAMAVNLGKTRLREAVREMCRATGGKCKLPWEDRRPT